MSTVHLWHRWLMPGLMLALGGCSMSNISGEWVCPVFTGKPCASIAEADAMFGNEGQGGMNTTRPIVGDIQAMAPGSAGRLRTSEVVGKVWIYPFVDPAGVYHEGNYVHLVLVPPGWGRDSTHLFPATTGDRPSGDSIAIAHPSEDYAVRGATGDATLTDIPDHATAENHRWMTKPSSSPGIPSRIIGEELPLMPGSRHSPIHSEPADADEEIK